MNSKHLATGDACPPHVNGKLRIYSMRFCPYAQRALLVAAAKKIPYEVVNINLMEKPEFIFFKNPLGKVPTIELDDKKCLYESLIVCDYLDEAYPHINSAGDGTTTLERLNSNDPFQKAQDRILIESFNNVCTVDNQVLYLPPEIKEDELIPMLEKLIEAIKPFDEELAQRGTKFFGGNERPKIVDYAIWPWVERLPSHSLLWGNSKFDFKKAFKNLTFLNTWQEEMKKDSAVQESYVDPETHLTYRLSKKRGNPNYDLLL